jgi:hypothetical protein
MRRDHEHRPEGESLRQWTLLLEQGGLGEVAARMLAKQASSVQ